MRTRFGDRERFDHWCCAETAQADGKGGEGHGCDHLAAGVSYNQRKSTGFASLGQPLGWTNPPALEPR